MKETCYFQITCLQWEPLLQLFRFVFHFPVALDEGVLSSVCQIDALLRNCFAACDEINK